jgi:hypothetical protein
MSSYILPHFGVLNLKSLQEHSEAQIVLAGHRVQLDLNFASSAIRATRMEIAKNILKHLEEHNTANLLTIRSSVNAESSLEGPGAVRAYIEHHMEPMPPNEGEWEEPGTVTDEINPQGQMVSQILSKIHLFRVRLYPESEDLFAVFDYSIGRYLSEYLLVLNLNEKGALESIALERSAG